MVRYSLTFSPFQISGLCEEEQIACEKALHLGDIVKRRRARTDAKAGGRGKTFPWPLAASRSLARSRLARPNRRACSQVQEQMKMSNLLEKGLPYLSSPLVRCVCLCGGWGWYLQCRRPLYSAHKRLSLQRGVEDINKGNEKPHFGNLLAEVRNDISRWIFEHRGGFFLEYVLL